MILGIEIALIILGLMALIRGKFQLSKSKVVVGLPARLLGVLALTPLPVAVLVLGVYTVTQVDPNDPRAVERWGEENKLTLMLIEAGVVIGITILLLVLAAYLGVPAAEANRRLRARGAADYDDYEDDRAGRGRSRRGRDD